MTLIEASAISRIYRSGEVEVAALRDVSLTIDAREFVDLRAACTWNETRLRADGEL